MDPTAFPMDFRDIKRVLVLKLKHIGDVLLATPCLRALRETFPEASLSALVNEETAAVLRNHPLLEQVLVLPRARLARGPRERLRAEWSLLRQIRAARFDMTVDLTSGDRAAWLSRLSGARFRLARDPLGKGFLGKRLFSTHCAPALHDPDLHEVLKNLGVLSAFGITCREPRLEMHPTGEDAHAAREMRHRHGLRDGQPFVIAHPTSRWLFKCWNEKRFAQLIAWVQERWKLPVLLTCGPDPREMERARAVLALCPQPPAAILGELTLGQWAALVHDARLFLGVDSAPMHIAASQGTPTLCFFGPTGFQNWRPWGVRHVVLARDCPCSRDRRPHCDWSRTRACLDAIPLEDAQEAVSRLLAP